MAKVVRKLSVCCLLLFAFAGSAAAQNDPLVVIKNNINGHDHYLAHDVNNALTAVTDAFDPATCLWYSGNTANVYGLHHNYYFIDGDGNYRFLSAPLQASGTLSLSATLPSIQLLRNTDQIYYFYDWDEGLARGHQYTGVDNNTCTHSWHWYNENDHSQGGECWEVYWIEYNANNEWRLTPESHYSRRPEEDGGHGGVPNAGLFCGVSITEYPIQVTSTDPDHPGLTGLTILHSEMNQGENQQLYSTISGEGFSYNYVPAYTKYVFEGGTHYFYGGEDHENAPTATPGSSGEDDATYEWTISGEGAYYLTFDDGGELVSTSTEETPTVYYSRPNTEGRKIATITLTVTYTNTGATQTLQANILLDVECQSPGISDVSITYEDVTISWYPTADSYRVYLTTIEDNWGSPLYEGDATSYTFTGFAYNTQYYYKVTGICGSEEKPAVQFDFTTSGEPGLLVYGSIFGGGRMADVTGNTKVAIINCDSIHAVYGGNDIAGVVQGAEGATITIGVAANDPNDFDDYGTTNAGIRICDVYGGGNGYYAYNGTSFEPASYNTVYHIEPDANIVEMTQLHQLGDTVWTNTTSLTKDLVCPTIKKTKITVTNDYVKIDSLFGGAKNAILNATSNDVTINIDGGTLFAVYGGNNFGGSLGYQSQEHIVVSNTKTKIGDDYHNGTLGRDFGIGYLFGGGNKVQGQHVYVTVNGGQLDTIFGGGNEADVRSTHVTVTCQLGALSNGAFGKVYSDAINSSYSSGDLSSNSINSNYSWSRSGIYNIRTLFGGNNRASMEGVPTLALTSGGIGTVYGGGNEGDMLAQEETTLHIPNSYGNAPNDVTIKYGTHVQTTSPNILIDYLYGGCQKSNVDYSTWAEINGGHIGTVYGGCNISGDVGSTRVNPNVPYTSPSEEYQEVQGGTYVWASGGTVYKNLFAGSNGFYHCNDGISYISGVDYCSPENYVGLAIPTHNETHVIVTGGVLVKGNVYAGGNMSPVGFTDATVGDRTFPQFVGLASLRMNGGEVIGNVFGGGNMASILGSNEVMVSGGSIGMTDAFEGSLYGGNDRSGQVGQISNRYFSGYEYASDGHTSLTDVKTYVGLTGTPDINTVYGGGNGFYDYEHGDEVIPAGHYCSYDEQGQFNDKPIQTNTFVDININGFPEDGGGHINTVYGGGDGVTVYGSIKVLLNVRGENGALPLAYDQVGTIFGGNNRDNVVEHDNAPLVPDIILLQGQVGTVYGGCNKGAMTTGKNFTIGGTTYDNVGSMVRLYSTYTTEDGHSATPTAVVSNAVYGGCRMNDVTYNSLVIMEGGADIPANLFGGCDISGVVQGTSRVVVTGGKALGNIYGGGNGNYYYADDHHVYQIDNHDVLVASNDNNDPAITAPQCSTSGVDIWGGQVGASGTGNNRSVFGGGYGHETQTTGNVLVNVGRVDAASAATTPLIYGDIYGGSALGSVNANTSNTTTVNFLNGTIHGNVYGGGLGSATLNGNGYIDTTQPTIEATVNGTVHVNIGDDEETNYSNYLNIDGNVFGGNNLAGTPKGNVFVDVYRTAHTSANTYPSSFPNPLNNDFFEVDTRYALGQVYGGGNLAHYVPTLENASTYVHVHNCDNTIQYVYGGGNAANVPLANVTIDGGLVKYVFGGGNGAGTGNPGANVSGDNTIALNGGVMGYVFGGSNTRGMVYGETSLQFRDEPYCNVRSVNELYGGGNQATDENGITLNVPCGTAGVKTIYGGAKNADVGANGAPANIILNVYGGDSNLDAVFGGNNLGGTIWGNVTLNLYGGIIDKAFGGNNAGGAIKGAIQVNMENMGGDCALGVNTIYGGGNDAAYSPTDASANAPEVNIKHGTVNNAVYGGGKGVDAVVTARPKVTIGDNNPNHSVLIGANLNGTTTPGEGNVYGGGDAAAVNGNTQVNIVRGEVTHKVVGGGNAASISGNTEVNISGGTLCTSVTEAGIYGGCNTSGNVGGNITINIDGSSTTPTTIGTQAALQAVAVAGGNPVSVHGGGYGHGTSTNGNITVNFGTDVIGESSTHNPYLTLYGDLYGGSALGTVNNDANDVTTVTILNGSVKSYMLGNTQYGGNIYGGGLGDVTHAATVNGEVHVNIGDSITSVSERIGKASLINCNVFGCNNKSGSPQRDVYVHVFQTNHTTSDIVTNLDGDYAIKAVYGGGNRADYEPTANYSGSYALKAHNYVHACDNTIGTVYGGGRAASADGVVTKVDGGRFEYIFGGGNGQIEPADIGWGGIDLTVCSGHVGYKYVGCDMGGNVLGALNDHECTDNPCDEPLIVDYFFFGANKATIIGGLIDTIPCDPVNPMVYKNVYAGSRLATIYGDIYMVVRGGIITNLFGGSQGSLDRPGHIRKFPHLNNPEEMALVPDDAHNDMITYLTLNPDLQGTGGNIYMKLEGGSITNVYGGNQLYGNIDGDIIVMVDTIPSNCTLSIDTLYGGNEKAIYNPDLLNGQPRISPQVYIKNGKVNYDVYGGSLGDRRSEIVNAGRVTSHPYVIVGSDQSADTAVVGRNLYGGGSMADVEGNTKIVLRGKATIDVVQDGEKEYGGNVYGGSRLGYVAGNTDVQIAPTATVTPIVIPTPPPPQFYRLYYSYNITEGGSIEVTDGYGHVLVSGSQVAQGTVLHIRAIPNTNAGYSFYSWGVSGGAAVVQPYQANTALIMGSSDATLGVNFVSSTMPHHTLTLTADPVAGGTFKVNNEIYTNPVSIPNGFSVTVQAMPADGYAFAGWTVVSGSVTITSGTNSTSSITFTMSGDVSLKANFVPAYILTLTATPEGACRFEVNEEFYDDPVSIPQGASVTIKANPVEGHTFTGWTIPDSVTITSGNTTSLTITITMGTIDATLTATFDE